MPDRHEESDGSEIFWPGYVDATTNLALNLLFLLTIMITAVFMFALEMGKSSMVGSDNPEEQAVAIVSKATPDQIETIVNLKLEIQRLNKMLAQQDPHDVKPGGLEKTVEATVEEVSPLKGLDNAQDIDFEIIVRFKDDAIAFSPAERARLLEILKPVVERGKSNIYVEVPAGFSEAKRMGFYRVMAVRNLLIEMKLPKEDINVSVIESKENANASIIMVR